MTVTTDRFLFSFLDRPIYINVYIKAADNTMNSFQLVSWVNRMLTLGWEKNSYNPMAL